LNERFNELALIGDITREELRIGDLCLPACCILATATLLDVFRYFGINAKPCKAVATIFNPVMAGRLESGETYPEDRREWFTDGSGCWAIGVGLGDPEPGKWCGHLVAITDDGYLCDLTIDQANRPHMNIELPQAIIAEPHAMEGRREAFLCGDMRLDAWINGCILGYHLDPSDQTFRYAPDWKKAGRRKPFAGAAIRRIRNEMARDGAA
jgi:hypothetical protein